jgi:hypothetical protein
MMACGRAAAVFPFWAGSVKAIIWARLRVCCCVCCVLRAAPQMMQRSAVQVEVQDMSNWTSSG